MATQVLVIEDNRNLLANIVDYLDGHGCVTDAAQDGVTGLHLAMTQSHDVIVLDLGLPGLDGVALCRKLRQAGLSTPIIMLTARGDLEDKVLGLEEGADDYLVKPVALRELKARIDAWVRRRRGTLHDRRLRVGDLELDESTLEVCRGGQAITLTRMDFEVLRVLMRESPRVVSRDRLIAMVWGDDLPESDTLRTHIHRIRRAIDHPFEQPLLHTVQGVGYRLVTPRAL